MSGGPRLPPVARAIREGDRRALAQLITRVENGDEEVRPVLQALYPLTGHARVIGFTGPLGVGKSSLINALIAELRDRRLTVAVVAVDPSSPFTGGSVLGDRIRIDRPVSDTGLFFRSMASRGHVGGVAVATREVVRLLDAAGFDVILVETVGSGQVDVDSRDVASTSVVVLIPHLGDEVQTLKAGLFEIADVFCINKADLPGADSAARYLSELVALSPPRDGWAPVIVPTSTTVPSGIPALWGAIEAHEHHLDAEGRRAVAQRRRVARELVDRIRDRVGREIAQAMDDDPGWQRVLEEVVARSLDPPSAADQLLAGWRKRR